MDILFFGRGVIATLYAWAFERAGHSVTFYVREGRKEEYGENINVNIIDTRRDKNKQRIKEEWAVNFCEDIEKAHNYDLIFVSANPEQVTAAFDYIAPRVGSATVLLMGNFWDDIRRASAALPLEQVVWGFPGAGGGYEGNRLYGGLYKTVTLGQWDGAPTKRELAVYNLFSGAGFKVMRQDDMQSFLRNHFIMNAAMEVSVLKTGSFKAAVSSTDPLVNMACCIREMIPIVVASGSKLDGQTKLLKILPPRLFGLMMSKLVFSKNSVPYALMEHNNYKPGAAVLIMIAEAKKYGIAVPRLLAVKRLL